MPGTRSGELCWASGRVALVCCRWFTWAELAPAGFPAPLSTSIVAVGKQKGNRHGFDFAIPGHFMSGWDWVSRWLEEWQDLPASKRATSGLNFSEHGVPYTTPQTVRIAQDLFTPLLGGSVASLRRLRDRGLTSLTLRLAPKVVCREVVVELPRLDQPLQPRQGPRLRLRTFEEEGIDLPYGPGARKKSATLLLPWLPPPRGPSLLPCVTVLHATLSPTPP